MSVRPGRLGKWCSCSYEASGDGSEAVGDLLERTVFSPDIGLSRRPPLGASQSRMILGADNVDGV